jgi:M6 family metalloprotease-like protein
LGAAKERAIRSLLSVGRRGIRCHIGRAAALLLTILPGAVGAQKTLAFPVATGEAVPPSAIAGLLDARPLSPLEFSRAWLLKVENVRRRRAELAAAGALDGLSADSAARLGAALTGALRVPVLPIRYKDVKEPFPVERLTDRLFGSPRGDTMTYSSYWTEVSGGLLSVTGAVTPWIALRKDAKHYLARDEYGWGQFGRMGEIRQEALKIADEVLDFTTYDNDGPDGMPNSGDDDGYVDFVAFVYALPCNGDARAGAIWPHRAAMPPYETKDVGSRGEHIQIADYVILPAVDPQTCGPLHVGVLAHETGHALGLPDLYDYDGSSQGIGAWGLMGTGSHNARYSPAHLSAWEKESLGWVTVSWLQKSGPIEFKPIERDRVVYRYDLPNRTGEYVLLENRQRIGSDRFLPGQGLLAWRVDPERGELGAWNRDERRSAVALVEADGRLDLRRGARADAGDPFPGATDQHTLLMADVPTFKLTGLDESKRSIVGWVSVGFDAPALIPSSDALRLTAVTGDSVVNYTMKVEEHGEVGSWHAAWTAEWLRATATPEGLKLEADSRRLPPGQYTEMVNLITESGEVAGRLNVDLYVALPGVPEVIATDLPWSWGLAARGPELFQASYGWDALGLRPRPRVLNLHDGDVHPGTLARLPADALYAPVPTPDGRGVFVLARARGVNFVYRIDSEGNASVVASRFGDSPAYGAALDRDSALLVAEWNGTVWRIASDGSITERVKFLANVYQIATDARGAIYAATYDGRVLRADPTGSLTIVNTGFEKGKLVAVAATPNGIVYAAERGDRGRIFRFDPDGSRLLVFQSAGARFYGLALDAEFLYALDLHERRLLRIPVNSAPIPAIVADR